MKSSNVSSTHLFFAPLFPFFQKGKEGLLQKKEKGKARGKGKKRGKKKEEREREKKQRNKKK